MPGQNDPSKHNGEGAEIVTKRQMVAACTVAAPDFRMRFERPNGVDTVVIAATTVDGPLAISMPVAGLGRAAVETRLLEAALAKLRKKATGVRL